MRTTDSFLWRDSQFGFDRHKIGLDSHMISPWSVYSEVAYSAMRGPNAGAFFYEDNGLYERLVYYFPIFIPYPVTIYKAFIGTSYQVAPNPVADLGLYQVTTSGAQKVFSTGSIPLVANGVTVNVPHTTIDRGQYYFAHVSNADNGTTLWYHMDTGQMGTLGGYIAGMRQQTNVYPLPASATFNTGSLTHASGMLSGFLIQKEEA